MLNHLKTDLENKNYHFVEEVFHQNEYVKNEFVKSEVSDDRKEAHIKPGGNNIIYLGANKDFFIREYNAIYQSCQSGDKLKKGDGEEVRHFVSKANLMAISAHVYEYLKKNRLQYKNPNFDILRYLDYLSGRPEIIEFGSEITFIKDNTNTKPYFKYFDPDGIPFIRELMIPYVTGYQVSIFGNDAGEFVYAWTINIKNEPLVETITVETAGEVTPTGKPHNLIVYGAPGTGKSHKMEEESFFFGTRKKRITFYPDYSYSKFVGTYKPFTYYKKPIENTFFYSSRNQQANNSDIYNEPVIDYSFTPGPFIQALIEALLSDEPYLLIIEEINRANAAAVFGEIFQLLDRKNGVSNYKVMLTEEAMHYLQEKLGNKYEKVKDGIFLPANLYIWATMNSADQGVFHMDAAFKRRWSFEYLPLNANSEACNDVNIIFCGKNYNWNSFRDIINSHLIANKIPEDRLIGPFFLSEQELSDKNSVKNKLLLYLRDDVLRHNHRKLFVDDTFSEIISQYDNEISVFVTEVNEKLESLIISVDAPGEE